MKGFKKRIELLVLKSVSHRDVTYSTENRVNIVITLCGVMITRFIWGIIS